MDAVLGSTTVERSGEVERRGGRLHPLRRDQTTSRSAVAVGVGRRDRAGGEIPTDMVAHAAALPVGDVSRAVVGEEHRTGQLLGQLLGPLRRCDRVTVGADDQDRGHDGADGAMARGDNRPL